MIRGTNILGQDKISKEVKAEVDALMKKVRANDYKWAIQNLQSENAVVKLAAKYIVKDGMIYND